MESIWQAGNEHKKLFPKNDPSPGLTATRDAVTGITGLKIDYTATVDLSGFQQLVNAMGGVWVNVKPDPNSLTDPRRASRSAAGSSTARSSPARSSVTSSRATRNSTVSRRCGTPAAALPAATTSGCAANAA